MDEAESGVDADVDPAPVLPSSFDDSDDVKDDVDEEDDVDGVASAGAGVAK